MAASSPASSRAAVSRQTYGILFALWLMVFSAASQVIVVTPILPEITATLGLSELQQSLLVGSYAIMLSVFALVTGPISDKIGRQRILLVGTAFMAVTLALHVVADSYVLLLAMRTLAGAGGGVLSGAAVAYVGDYFPYERRGWANGWVMSGTAVGQVAGVPLGKVLANAFGYRWPFLLFAVTMGLAAVLIWRLVPQPDTDLDEDRLTVGNALRNYAALLRQGAIVAAVGAYFLMFLGIGLFVVFLPTWLETQVGVSSNQVALLFAIGGAANVLASPVAGSLSDRIGRKPLVITSCVGMSALILATTFVIDGFAMAAVLFFGTMVMVGMRISPLQSLLTALVPDRRRGLLMGMAVGLGYAGIGLGSVIAGGLYAHYSYLSNTAAAAVVMLAMAVLVWKGLPEPRLARPAQTTTPEATAKATAKATPEAGRRVPDAPRADAPRADAPSPTS